MAVPTRTVTIRAFESDGTPIEAAPVKARMNGTDIYQNQLVDRIEENAVTDALGIATIALFPNTLGENDTAYVFTVRHPLDNRKIFQTVAKVPDNDCELTEIMCNTEPQHPAPGFVGTGEGVVVKSAGLYILRDVVSGGHGIEVLHGDGTDGNITIQPDHDLAALEALGTSGVPERIGLDLWTQFPISPFGKQVVNMNDAAALAAFLNAVPISGGTMTGPLILWADPTDPLGAATKQYVDARDLSLVGLIDAGDAQRVLKTGDTMSGPLVLSGDPTIAFHASTKQYVDTLDAAQKAYIDGQDTLISSGIIGLDAAKVNRAGDVMGGPLTLAGDPTVNLHASTKQYVDTLDAAQKAYIDVQDGTLATSISGLNTSKVNRAGDVMLGPLTLSGDPTLNLHAATKQYVDAAGGGGGGGSAHPDGTLVAPGISWTNETTAGFWRVSPGVFRYAIGGADKMEINATVVKTDVPLLVADGTLANPGFGFRDEFNVGFRRTAGGVMTAAIQNVNAMHWTSTAVAALVQMRTSDGTIGAPGLSFSNETTMGWIRNAPGSIQYVAGGAVLFGMGPGGAGITVPISLTGVVAVGGQLLVSDGTVGAPGITWSSEPTSGWYRASANVFNFAVAGTPRLQVTAAGGAMNGNFTVNGFGIFNSSVVLNATSLYLDNNQHIYFRDAAAAYMFALTANNSNWLLYGAGASWLTHIFYTGGAERFRVNAGGASVTGTLNVTGGAGFGNSISLATNTAIFFANSAAVSTSVLQVSSDLVYFNLGGFGSAYLYGGGAVLNLSLGPTEIGAHIALRLFAPLRMPNNIALNFRNAANTADVNAMYADAGNNLHIGSSWLSQVFWTNGNQRASINSAGAFKATTIGATFNPATPVHEFVVGNLNNYVVQFLNNAVPTPYGWQSFFSVATSGDRGVSGLHWYCLDVSGGVGGMYSNGGIFNFKVNDADISDARAKREFSPCEDHTRFVKALTFHRFQYIDNPNSGYVEGITAQDIEELAPELVTNFGDSGMKGVYTHRLQTRINSVIPRLIERIEKLEAMLIP